MHGSIIWYHNAVVATQSLPKDGDIVEDNGAPEGEKLPRACTRGPRETESPKSERGKESEAGQCRMR